jgi:hypothetical protein
MNNVILFLKKFKSKYAVQTHSVVRLAAHHSVVFVVANAGSISVKNAT